jgi:hypothetical protein
LTGAPVECIDHEYTQDVWNKVNEVHHQGSIICAIPEREVISKYAELDLISAYAYTITNSYEVEADKSVLRLIEIRNLDAHKWLGMFSDTSTTFEEELVKKGMKSLKSLKSLNDTLLISIEDYLCYFCSTII